MSESINHNNNLQQTLLLVDDSPINLELLMESLDGLGYRLLSATGGQEALDLARAELPDLILLDVLMPRMDGFEVCHRLRAEAATASIPVIFLSALGELEDKVRGLGLGAVDYIAKPFRLEEVIARVHTHLTIDQLKKKVQAQRDALERELQQVAETQRSLLPKNLPQIPGLQLGVHYETSRYAGGDLYDLLPLDKNRWGILVADAEGHSTPAAVLMAMCCALFRSFSGDATDPAAVLSYLNDGLCKVADERLVTAIYAVYDPQQRSLCLARAGHLPPLFSRPSSCEVRELDCEGGWPLGLKCYAAGDLPVCDMQLEPGDRLLLYTDGLLERFNDRDEIYGIERLKQKFVAAPLDTPQQILQQIHADAAAFAAGRAAEDDQTLLLAIIE